MHPDKWYQLFGSPIMSDDVWCIPTSGINYSVLPSCRMPFSASRHVVSIIRFSHHVGCRLVHPDTWYHLFGSPIMSDAVWCIPTSGINYSVLPSCRMTFGASRQVVSIIRFSHHVGCRLVHPDTWYQLFGSPIMSDAVWCIPTRGITYSVLPSCRMPFSASLHLVSIKCHTPSRRMPIGASRQVGHFFNAIRHHDGCRLVHPAKWDIGKFRGAFVTDAD